MSSNVPYGKLSTESIDPALRQEFWVDNMREMHDVAPIDKDNPQFYGSAEAWDTGDVCFGLVKNDASILDHRRSKHNRSGVHEYLFMTAYRDGGGRTLQDGKPTQHGLHDVHLFDYACDRRTISGRMTLQTAMIPYQAIGYEPGQHASSLTFANATASGHILSKFALMILEQLPNADFKEARGMADMLTGMLRSLIAGDTADESSKMQAVSARRAVMHRFVIDNIHDLGLNVETLCRKFDVSRATVFRDFEPGGLQHFLLLHRLDRALNDIANGPAIRGRIALIANQWGFSSPAHFSRAFREHFGVSPSDVLGVGREAGGILAQERGRPKMDEVDVPLRRFLLK